MRKQNIIYAVVAITTMVISFVTGFILSGNKAIINKPISQAQINAEMHDNTLDNNTYEVNNDAKIDTSSSEVSSTLDEVIPNEKTEDIKKITPSTKMVYEYYYLGDGKTETTEEIPPYFLLDMTEQEMRDTFIDWDILVFNSDEVVMRKNLQGKSNQYYVIGAHEGYIAVFYETETNGTTLKELTDMPLSAFPKDEQDRIMAGIHVSGSDELMKILEDYGS